MEKTKLSDKGTHRSPGLDHQEIDDILFSCFPPRERLKHALHRIRVSLFGPTSQDLYPFQEEPQKRMVLDKTGSSDI